MLWGMRWHNCLCLSKTRLYPLLCRDTFFRFFWSFSGVDDSGLILEFVPCGTLITRKTPWRRRCPPVAGAAIDRAFQLVQAVAYLHDACRPWQRQAGQCSARSPTTTVLNTYSLSTLFIVYIICNISTQQIISWTAMVLDNTQRCCPFMTVCGDGVDIVAPKRGWIGGDRACRTGIHGHWVKHVELVSRVSIGSQWTVSIRLSQIQIRKNLIGIKNTKFKTKSVSPWKGQNQFHKMNNLHDKMVFFLIKHYVLLQDSTNLKSPERFHHHRGCCSHCSHRKIPNHCNTRERIQSFCG